MVTGLAELREELFECVSTEIRTYQTCVNILSIGTLKNDYIENKKMLIRICHKAF